MNKAPRYMREYASTIKKSAEAYKKDLIMSMMISGMKQ